MFKLAVSVTQEDIDNGRRDSPWECPIAQALNRLGYFASVVPTDIYVKKGFGENQDPKQYRAEPTEEAAKFMYNFDSHNPVIPTAFDLEFN